MTQNVVTMRELIALQTIYQSFVSTKSLFNVDQATEYEKLSLVHCKLEGLETIGNTCGYLYYSLVLQNTFGQPVVELSYEDATNSVVCSISGLTKKYYLGLHPYGTSQWERYAVGASQLILADVVAATYEHAYIQEFGEGTLPDSYNAVRIVSSMIYDYLYDGTKSTEISVRDSEGDMFITIEEPNAGRVLVRVSLVDSEEPAKVAVNILDDEFIVELKEDVSVLPEIKTISAYISQIL